MVYETIEYFTRCYIYDIPPLLHTTILLLTTYSSTFNYSHVRLIEVSVICITLHQIRIDGQIFNEMKYWYVTEILLKLFQILWHREKVLLGLVA